MLVNYFVRTTAKEAKKEEILKEEKQKLYNRITELAFQVERQDAQIREVVRKLGKSE